MIPLCISFFRLVELTAAVKLVSRHQHSRKFSYTFSQPLPASRSFFQPLVAPQNLDPGANHKPFRREVFYLCKDNNIFVKNKSIHILWVVLHRGNGNINKYHKINSMFAKPSYVQDMIL